MDKPPSPHKPHKPVLGSQEIVVAKPQNLKEHEQELFTKQLTVKGKKWLRSFYPVLLEHVPASVDGHGLVYCTDLSGEKKALFSLRIKDRVIEKLYWFLRKTIHFVFPKTELDSAIMVSDLDTHTYFHWAVELLPKLFLLSQQEKSFLQDIPILLPQKNCKSYAFDSLRPFVDEKRMRIIPLWKRLEVKNLFVVPCLAPPYCSGNCRPDLMQAMRKRVLEYLDETIDVRTLWKKLEERFPLVTHRPYRIYFSRKDAPRRYIKNESEILSLLEQYDFLYIKAETLSFWEQVLLCSKADSILGLHGAALSNMMWMKPSARVIEIRKHDEYKNNCYFILADAMNIRYYYFLAQADQEETHEANFTVEVEKLEELLRNLYKNSGKRVR